MEIEIRLDDQRYKNRKVFFNIVSAGELVYVRIMEWQPAEGETKSLEIVADCEINKATFRDIAGVIDQLDDGVPF